MSLNVTPHLSSSLDNQNYYDFAVHYDFHMPIVLLNILDSIPSRAYTAYDALMKQHVKVCLFLL